MQFGQKSAVQTAQRRLSNILQIVKERIVARILPWSYWTPHGLRTDVDPMRCWDFHPAVYHWRQQRYEDAKSRGATDPVAFLETIPLDVKGYIDDTLEATIVLFADLFFEELLRYCDASGILLSIPKFQKADAFQNLYTMSEDRQWLAPVVGCLAPLGKLLKMSMEYRGGALTPLGTIIEKPARVRQIVRRTRAFLAHATDHKQMASFDDMEHIIGVFLYMATTIIAMVPVLQYPLRNLHARFSHHRPFETKSSPHARVVGKTFLLVPRARQALELLMVLAESNPGVAFAHDTSPIDWSTAIWVVHDAAGDSGVNDYRGRFTLLFIPGSSHTCYVKGR
jgi:hypothetical protein